MWEAADGVPWALVANYAYTLSLLYILVHYRKTKKHKAGEVLGLWDFLDRNWVELVLTGMIFPSLIESVARLPVHLLEGGT